MSPSEFDHDELSQDIASALEIAREVYGKIHGDAFNWGGLVDIAPLATLAKKVMEMRGTTPLPTPLMLMHMSDKDIAKRLIAAGKRARLSLQHFGRQGSGRDMRAVCTLAVTIVDKLTGDSE